ncbi:MAG: aldo/keto reductase, partial [Pseudomonadales bacterium]|nr:aldo/keto reductase [Pseudomonadales bacterium]
MKNRGHDMGIETRNLGTSGVAVTALGFGGATLGGVGDRVSETEADEVVHAAFTAGIRYFDTAPLYGHGLSEKRLGRTLAALPRDEFVLSTKVGRLLVPRDEGQRYAGMRDNEPFAIRYDYSYDAVRQSIESSLERLGLDRIDVLLCHDIDVWTHGDEQQGIFDAAING